MNRSRNWQDNLIPEHSALQHEPSPRPLPLFLELVRMVAERDPEMARAALDGLSLYERAKRPPARPARAEAARVGPATLRDHGGSGAPAVLVPSLINPPDVLDLDSDVSLASAVAAMGRNVLLLDWGDARRRADLGVAGHVEQLLLPLLREIGEPAALVGYCLGGTMAIAAANHVPCERVVTLAAPWRFGGYPSEGREALLKLWQNSHGTAEALGALPMELLQAAFWSLDPERTVSKFAHFARLDPGSAQALRFIALEDWANEGEPLPCPAARELIEDLFGDDLPGNGRWCVGGKMVSDLVPAPALHLTAAQDRITPAASAPCGETVRIGAGHVGMIVGSKRRALHQELKRFLDPACR